MEKEKAKKTKLNLVLKKIVMVKDIGVHGNMFGGILMAWIDEAAAAFATEYCHTPNMVTIHFDEFTFKKPLKAGHHIRIYAGVLSLGNTSIQLKIEAYKYNLYSAEETLVCSTKATFVRIDDDGTPTPIGETIKRNHTSLLNLEAAI